MQDPGPGEIRSRRSVRARSAATQPAVQDERPEAALREQERRRGATAAALTVEDVLTAPVEHLHRVPDFRQRDVDRAREFVVLVLGWIARVDPLSAGADLRPRLLHRHALEQRLLEQL